MFTTNDTNLTNQIRESKMTRLRPCLHSWYSSDSWSLLFLLFLLPAVAQAADPKKPNVLFIAVDDLNHWVGHLGRNTQTKTSNMPWDVPKKYYDLFPLDTIELPPTTKDDLSDVPDGGLKFAKPDGDHAAMLKSGRWKEAVQGYLAAVAYCDAQIGRLLDAYDQSPHKESTVIVFWGDHGWHLGEKEHWRKFALWEESTRMPYMWVVPGVTKAGGVCDRTVDLMSVYPTLYGVCGIDRPKHVEGEDIKPLLADPKAAWDKPAITTYHRNNHSIRTGQWRYIRYAGGGEELYDHAKDEYEWTNLAKDAKYADVKKELMKPLPAKNEAELPRAKE